MNFLYSSLYSSILEFKRVLFSIIVVILSLLFLFCVFFLFKLVFIPGVGVTFGVVVGLFVFKSEFEIGVLMLFLTIFLLLFFSFT